MSIPILLCWKGLILSSVDQYWSEVCGNISKFSSFQCNKISVAQLVEHLLADEKVHGSIFRQGDIFLLKFLLMRKSAKWWRTTRTTTTTQVMGEQMVTFFVYFTIEVPSEGLFWTTFIARQSSPTMLVYFTIQATSVGCLPELAISFLPHSLVFGGWPQTKIP